MLEAIEKFRAERRGRPESEMLVGRGEVLTVRVPNPDTGRRRIMWQFNTEGYDIGFGLDYERGEGAEVTPILPIMRVRSHQEIVKGTHVADGAGCWLLKFDNSYSYMRSKPLFYDVTCAKA